MAGQVADVAVKWSNAVDTIQKTTAQANFKTGLLDIQNRAQNDPNYNNSDQYFKEIEKLKNDNLKGFQSKTAETEMAINLGYESQVAKIQIDNLYKKKLIDVGQTSTFRLLDMEIANGGPDIEQRVRGILDTQIQAGIFDQKDAYNIEKQYVKKGKFNNFLSDIQANPKMASDNLTKNSYEFDVKELSDARSIFNSESQKLQAINQNELLNRYLSGEEIPVDEVKSMMKEERIGPSFAEDMIHKINNPKPDQPSQDAAYIEWQNKVMDMQEKGDKATTKDLIKMMSDVIKDHSKGLLDKSDVQRILKDRNEVLQKKLDKSVKEDVLNVIRPKSFLDRITFWSDEYADAGLNKDEIKARMYRKFIDGMASGSDPDMLASKVVNDEIEIGMARNLNKPDRAYALDPETKERKAYSDDGGATWTDIKTGKEIK